MTILTHDGVVTVGTYSRNTCTQPPAHWFTYTWWQYWRIFWRCCNSRHLQQEHLYTAIHTLIYLQLLAILTHLMTVSKLSALTAGTPAHSHLHTDLPILGDNTDASYDGVVTVGTYNRNTCTQPFTRSFTYSCWQYWRISGPCPCSRHLQQEHLHTATCTLIYLQLLVLFVGCFIALCISGTDLLRQLYVLSYSLSLISYPVTVHLADQSQWWSHNARSLAG